MDQTQILSLALDATMKDKKYSGTTLSDKYFGEPLIQIPAFFDMVNLL
jgi:hypothetical protein